MQVHFPAPWLRAIAAIATFKEAVPPPIDFEKDSVMKDAISARSQSPAGARLLHRLGAKAAVIACGLSVAGCAAVESGPAVPAKSGSTVFEARQSLAFCAPQGPKGAKAAVTSSYIASMLFLGILPGAVIAAAGEEHARSQGAVNAVDDCLKDQGYERRELTAEETTAIKQRDRYAREQLLSHLIGGGTLADYTGP
jgi:hypothetical protein